MTTDKTGIVMSEQCVTCRWWQPDLDGYTYNGLAGSTINGGPPNYDEVPAPFETRYCRSPKLFFYERPLTASHAAIVDGSRYRAELITGPEFGCANHEVVDE